MVMLNSARFPDLLKDHPDALAALVCGLLVLVGALTLQTPWIGLALLLLAVAYVVGGYESAREGLTTLFEEKELDVDLLMIVAALGAAALGLWRREYHLIVDGAILILIFAISGALEGYAMQRTERSIRSLMSLSPDVARIRVNGQEKEVAVDALTIGDEILVKPGELVPADGLIREGTSALNEAAITGESMPVEKTVGEEVFAGTLNGFGALTVQLHQPPESSLLQRVIRMVEQAQTEKPPSQQFIERFERGYAKVIVLLAIVLAILPPFVLGWNWETTIYRALIFLVVASPCALMAAIMPTLLSGIANGARQGILFKNGAQLEQMGRVQAIAFDKTGTLTTGKPDIQEVIPAAGRTAGDVLMLAASLESYSEHPIAQAIRCHVPTSPYWIKDIQAHPGLGISGELEGETVKVGKASFVAANVPDDLAAQSDRLEQEGSTVIWVSRGETVLGLIAVADQIRPEAAKTVAQLQRLGIRHLVMLTGDNDRTAQSVARRLGISEVQAELLPEDKLHVIRRLQQQYGSVAMVGDGINDAPALAQASVGIAMGTAGSDVALETADIVLMADRLDKLVAAIRLGRRSQRIVKQNIAFALSFIALLLLANFAGQITLPLGVFGHEGSTVAVTLSGLRLLRQ